MDVFSFEFPVAYSIFMGYVYWEYNVILYLADKMLSIHPTYNKITFFEDYILLTIYPICIAHKYMIFCYFVYGKMNLHSFGVLYFMYVGYMCASLRFYMYRKPVIRDIYDCCIGHYHKRSALVSRYTE